MPFYLIKQIVDNYQQLFSYSLFDKIYELLPVGDVNVISTYAQAKNSDTGIVFELAILTDTLLYDLEIGDDRSHIAMSKIKDAKLVGFNVEGNKAVLHFNIGLKDIAGYFYSAFTPDKVVELKKFYNCLAMKWERY